jgi:hypothetical protein
MPPISRRTLHKLLLTAPAAALASTETAAQGAQPSAFAACVAASETTLSAAERGRLAKAIGSLEASLKIIRDFKVPADADPAMHFRPLRSGGGR